MAELSYTEAFAGYGAKLHNPQWSVAATADDGSLVVALYQNWLKFDRATRELRYTDKLSEWKGNTTHGRPELAGLLSAAHAAGTPVRLVVVTPKTPEDAALVGNVANESVIEKTFAVRTNLVGHVTAFDGDTVVIVFKQRPAT
jgi:hypothetical protein